MALTAREKLWYPIVCSVLAYTICVAVSLPIGVGSPEPPIFLQLIFGFALTILVPLELILPGGVLATWLVQFVIYGTVIGAGWRTGKLRWCLSALLVVHLLCVVLILLLGLPMI